MADPTAPEVAPGGVRREPPRVAVATEPADLADAVTCMRRQRGRAVVIDPDIGSHDAVDFMVAVKLGEGELARWADVPFVILPLPGTSELLVYRGYEDFAVASLGVVRIEQVVGDLLTGRPPAGGHDPARSRGPRPLPPLRLVGSRAPVRALRIRR